MVRRRIPVSTLVSLVVAVVMLPVVHGSAVKPVYALPPASMFLEHENASAATVPQMQVVKPPEILLRNSLLRKGNASQHVRSMPVSSAGMHSDKPRGFFPHPPVSPTPVLVPIPTQNQNNANFPPPTHMSLQALGQLSMGPGPKLFTPNNNNVQFHSNGPQKPSINGTNLAFRSSPPFNSFNEVDMFANFVPLDYENGHGQFVPPHQKREAQRANRRADQRPQIRRSSNSTLKNIISSFHERVSRMFLGGSRSRGPKPSRPSSAVNDRFDPIGIEEGRNFNLDHPQLPVVNDGSFVAALNTVAQVLQENQYFPMMGKRERFRSLSPEESQNLDKLRRRDRGGRRRPPPRRRHPRKRRPYHRPSHQHHEEDAPPKYHHRDPYQQDDEEDYGKPNYNRYPKHFNDDVPPHKDHGPPYKNLKSFGPWKQNFDSYEDQEEHYGYKGRQRGRKPAWPLDSGEKGTNHHQSRYRTHHHEKYKEYPEFGTEGTVDADGFKSIKPFYGGIGTMGRLKDWDEKKMKFHKVFDYDHGMIGVNHFSSPLKHGASMPSSVIKDEDARIPKIIINHHHNLPPAAPGGGFGPGAFPGNAVVSYSPPVHHFHDDFFRGPPGGRGGRGKKEYKSTEFADSFIVNDYGKPPIPGFGMPHAYPPQPPMHHNGPPPPPAHASPHMVFEHFAQNMPPHFMPGKLQEASVNHAPPQGPFPGPHNGGHPVSFSNTHFPRPMIPGGHYTNQVAPGFPNMAHHHESGDPFGKPIASQMANFNEDFPQATPHSHEDGPGPSHGPPDSPPLSDSSPFPSSNEQHQDGPTGFIPPFSPVPTQHDDITLPSQGPTTSSRESFFRMKPLRKVKKVPRKFEFKIVKTLSSGFDIPEKLTSHPLAEPKPTPIMNYFDLGVPDREHYKKKQQQRKQNQSQRANSNSNSREDQHNRQSSLPSLSKFNKFESNEFNYSTLPENWNSFRPDPSHNKLPSLTHDTSVEVGSRMGHKIRNALHPKSLVNALMSRFPGARRMDKSGRAHAKFTPFDAKSRESREMSSSNRRRKSTKAPASIQDIIDSDSSNHNKEVLVTLSEDDELTDDNSAHQNNHHHQLEEVAPSSVSPTVVTGKFRRKKVKAKVKGGALQHRQLHVSNEMKTEMPFSDLDDDVLLGMHNINIPLTAQIRMGEVADEKKKKK